MAPSNPVKLLPNSASAAMTCSFFREKNAARQVATVEQELLLSVLGMTGLGSCGTPTGAFRGVLSHEEAWKSGCATAAGCGEGWTVCRGPGLAGGPVLGGPGLGLGEGDGTGVAPPTEACADRLTLITAEPGTRDPGVKLGSTCSRAGASPI